ncbi:MAG TPA: MFS transporter [Acetivibrio clariflavus]|nr:MFS transporter [Acetivibrio clariflavus]
MMKKTAKINTILTLTILILSASLDNAILGLFPSLFSSISEDLNINVSIMGVVSAVTIFFSAISSVFWGYMADKGKRKPLLIIGTFIFTFSTFLTSFSQNYFQLIIYQIFTGIGLGCIGSIGYSVLTDFIPKKHLGTLLSLWGLSQGFGGIAGAIIAPIISTHSTWRQPFIIISIIDFIFIFSFFFMKEPEKGSAEPELKDLQKEGIKYNYSIKLSHIPEIAAKRSNKWLMMQGFFMQITIGTLIWLPTLYASKIRAEGINADTAAIAAGYFYGLLQMGGLSSTYFGYLGDKIQSKTYRGRALLTGSLILAAIPLYVLMFLLPMDNLILPASNEPFLILISLVKQFFTNPWILLMFILAVLATAAQSANTPNWLALLTDINLPEHRATAFSISNLINGFGRSIGNILIGIVLNFISLKLSEPYNYIYTMILFQLFFIPAVYCYYKVSENSGRDIRKVKSTLKLRAKKLS